MGTNYEFKYMDVKGNGFGARPKSSIFKTKLKIVLVATIIFNVYSFINKREAGYTLPGQIAEREATGFSSPAYASDNGGRELNIPYSPYMAASGSDMAQAQAAAMAEAERMIQSGDTSAYEAQLRANPYTAQMMNLR